MSTRFDPRTMSLDELNAIAGGDDIESANWLDDENSGRRWLEGAKQSGAGIGRRMLDISSHGITGGLLSLAGLPSDLVNMGSQLIAGKDIVAGGSQEYLNWAKKHGFIYEIEDPNFMDRFNRKTAEGASLAGIGGTILKSFADMLKAGKVVPQTVNAARSVFQRLMADAANNPQLVVQEIKAGTGAGAAAGTIKAAFPDAPIWVEMIAELVGGVAGSKGKPPVTSRAGQEEQVVESLSTLHGSTPEGLQQSISQGRARLQNPDGSDVVPGFDPTTGQVAIRPEVTANGEVVTTRPLSPYVKAAASGSPELQARLESQSRAVSNAIDETLTGDPDKVSQYPLELSQAGRTIRSGLESGRASKQAETTKAYEALDDSFTSPVNDLFDEGVKILTTRSEADDVTDMPKDVQRFMNTFKGAWPDDVMRGGKPLTYDDLIALRAKALETSDKALLDETSQYIGRLNPEKSIKDLKGWRTKAMEKLEDAKGTLKNKLGQFRRAIESTIDSFGDVDPTAPPEVAAQRKAFRDASTLNRELKQTFDEGPAGEALNKEFGRYTLGESDIPDKFVGTTKQPESWEALVKATKDPSEATRAARRILAQRFQRSTTNQQMLPEGEKIVSASKMNRFLDNPDNKELILGAYGKEHYDRLKQLEEAARLRESILSAPGVGGSNTKEKIEALEKLQAGKEIDRFFASMVLRLGFVARAGRAGTQMYFDRANEAMDRMFRDALIDPQYLDDLLSRVRTDQARRARARYRLYFADVPGFTKRQMPVPETEEETTEPTGYKAGGAVREIDLSGLLALDQQAFASGRKWL